MAIRELAVEEFEVASGAAMCNDIYTAFTGGFGAALGASGGPAGAIVGGTVGAALGGWLGGKFCS